MQVANMSEHTSLQAFKAECRLPADTFVAAIPEALGAATVRGPQYESVDQLAERIWNKALLEVTDKIQREQKAVQQGEEKRDRILKDMSARDPQTLFENAVRKAMPKHRRTDKGQVDYVAAYLTHAGHATTSHQNDEDAIDEDGGPRGPDFSSCVPEAADLQRTSGTPRRSKNGQARSARSPLRASGGRQQRGGRRGGRGSGQGTSGGRPKGGQAKGRGGGQSRPPADDGRPKPRPKSATGSNPTQNGKGKGKGKGKKGNKGRGKGKGKGKAKAR